MVCPKCNHEVDDVNSVCPFCNEPLKETEGGDFYGSFEMKDNANQQSTGTKAYIPKKATEGLGLKIAVGVLIVIIGIFVFLYVSTEHLFCNGFNGGKFAVFYNKDKIIYCFQSGQAPGDCKAVKSMTKDALERLGYHDYDSFMQSLKIQIESTGIGNCQ